MEIELLGVAVIALAIILFPKALGLETDKDPYFHVD